MAKNVSLINQSRLLFKKLTNKFDGLFPEDYSELIIWTIFTSSVPKLICMRTSENQHSIKVSLKFTKHWSNETSDILLSMKVSLVRIGDPWAEILDFFWWQLNPQTAKLGKKWENNSIPLKWLFEACSYAEWRSLAVWGSKPELSFDQCFNNSYGAFSFETEELFVTLWLSPPECVNYFWS